MVPRWLVIALLTLAALLVTQRCRAEEAVLRVGLAASDVVDLDPHRTRAPADRALVSWMFNGLVRFKPGSANPADIEGDLAADWDSSEDGLVWTFYLRRGVRFHGGWGELDAEDVRYSLMRAADPARSAFAADFAALDHVEVLSRYVVRVVLKAPIASALSLLANHRGGYIVSQAAAERLGERFRLEPVGTGPFAMAGRTPSRELRLTAHEAYFRGKPRIDLIVVRFLPVDEAREAAYRAGEIDLFAMRGDAATTERVRALAATRIDAFGPGEYYVLMLDRRVPPIDDRRVREAIARAIDGPRLVATLGRNAAVPGRSVVPPDALGEVSDGWTYAFDIARARQLLAGSGHPGGIAVKALLLSAPVPQAMMQTVEQGLRRAGIALDLDAVDAVTYAALARKDAAGIVLVGAARLPVADVTLTEFYHSRVLAIPQAGAANLSHCEVADDDIDKARVEPDPARQLALWRSAQAKIHADICAVPLVALRQIWVRRERLDYGYELRGAIELAPMLTEASTLQ